MPPRPSFIPLRLLSASQRPFICQSCSRRLQNSLSPSKSEIRQFSVLPSLCHFQITKVYAEDMPKPERPPATLRPEKDIEPWQINKAALKAKFGGQPWMPRKRLSPDALDGIRTLHQQYPDKFTTPVLAKQFEVSPEAIRRILKGKWRPTGDEAEERRKRWERRGKEIWEKRAEAGEKPPKKWREEGVGKVKQGEGVPRWKRPQWGRERDLNDAISRANSEEGAIIAIKKEEP